MKRDINIKWILIWLTLAFTILLISQGKKGTEVLLSSLGFLTGFLCSHCCTLEKKHYEER